jgi:hypothetical protein
MIDDFVVGGVVAVMLLLKRTSYFNFRPIHVTIYGSCGVLLFLR